MDALEVFDRLEAKAIADATRRLRKLSGKEIAVLWAHYFTLNYPGRDDAIRALAIQLVDDDR